MLPRPIFRADSDSDSVGAQFLLCVERFCLKVISQIMQKYCIAYRSASFVVAAIDACFIIFILTHFYIIFD